MDAKLRRHKLVQQRAEQSGERSVLASVNRELLIETIYFLDNLVLLFWLRYWDDEAAQTSRADVALADRPGGDGLQSNLCLFPIEIVVQEERPKTLGIRTQTNQVGRKHEISLKIEDGGSAYQFEAVGAVEEDVPSLNTKFQILIRREFDVLQIVR